MYTAWTIKYKPKTLSEVVGNEEAIKKLCEWIKSWDRGIPKKRAAFLYGPPGVGKTVSVEALAKDLDMELVEKNASDYRTAEDVKKFAGLASRSGTLFGKRRLILFDELDGITGTVDRGGVQALMGIIRSAACPIVLIANNPYDPRFAGLRELCLMIEFKKPRISDVVKHLKKICMMEGIKADENALKFIAQRSKGDVRSAVNDLQALGQGKNRLTYDDVSWLAFRDRKESIFDVLKMIFYSKKCSDAKMAFNMSDVDLDMLLEWIYENVPYQLTHPRDLAKAMNALSLADLYRARMKMTQNWELMRYVIDLMTAGVAMSRKETISKWAPFKFPTRIKALSRIKEDRKTLTMVGMKIGIRGSQRCHPVRIG